MMSRMNRRDFLKRSAAGLATLPAALPAAAADTPLLPTTQRTLGNTGIKTTLLGIGTGTKAWNKSSEQNRAGRESFLRTLTTAYERGLRYYDLADMYGSHEYFRDAAKQAGMRRDELTVLTKTNAQDLAGVRADMDRMRAEAGVDYFDIVLIHCMTDKDWNVKMRPVMDWLEEAKQKGVIRAHGVSCHSLEALETAAAEPWAEVMLSRINPFGAKMDGPPETVVPVLKKAHASGKGMLGMKIVGEGKHVDRMAESARYVLGLGCIHAFTIGMVRHEEVDDTIAKITEAARS